MALSINSGATIDFIGFTGEVLVEKFAVGWRQVKLELNSLQQFKAACLGVGFSQLREILYCFFQLVFA